MSRGRPRKPKALKDLEGDKGKGRRPSSGGPVLHGTPEQLKESDYMSGPHFRFMAAEFGTAGVLARADSPALAMMAALWEDFWQARFAKDYDLEVKLSRAWYAAAARMGLTVVDRQKLMMEAGEEADPVADKFFKVMG